jgi:hypothetical protein
MNIAGTHSSPFVRRNAAPVQPKQQPSIPKMLGSAVDTFLDNGGIELLAGGTMAVIGTVPVIGAMCSYTQAEHCLGPEARPSAFERVAGLTLYAAAAANVVGTAALFAGSPPLGAALLAGGGLVSGINTALLMDGGLAGRLGLH